MHLEKVWVEKLKIERNPGNIPGANKRKTKVLCDSPRWDAGSPTVSLRITKFCIVLSTLISHLNREGK